MNDPLSSPGRAIERKLLAIRRRRRLRMAAIAALTTAAACLAVLTLDRVLAFDGTGPFPLAAGVLLASACTLALVIVLVMRRTGDLAETARKADVRFDLAERLSSALEVQRVPATDHGPVARALMRDAARRAASIESAAAEPLLSRGVLVGVAAVLVAVAAYVLVAPPDPERTGDAGLSVETGADARSPETLADQIWQMADLIAADAERRDDSYLAAVADSLDELAEAAPAMSREDLLGRFAELADHAARGYGEDLPVWMPETAEQFADIGQRMADFAAQMNESAPERIAGANAPMRPESGDVCMDEGAASCDDGTDWALWNELLPEQRGSGAALSADRRGDGMATGPMLESGVDDGEEIDLQMLEFEAGVARPIGANTDSGRGAGDAIGDGSQDFARSTDFLDAEMGASQRVEIAAGEDDAGNRIQIDLLPETAYSEVLDDGMTLASEMYRWDEALSARDPVQLNDRAVVSRYFSRSPVRRD